MDSKAEFPASYDHDAAPPSYAETLSPSSINLFPASASSTSQFYSAQIQDQLLSLTSQIRSRQTQKSDHAHREDERMLASLTTEVQGFLADFAGSGVQRGTLILVPADTVSEGATPMEYDFRDPDEYDRVVRLRSKEVESGGWFWRDEDMARRLARYLSPEPVWGNLPSRTDERSLDGESGENAARRGSERRKEKSPVKEVQKQSKGGFFSFRKKGTIGVIDRPPAVDEKDTNVSIDAKAGGASSEDTVFLDVKTHEVAFRMENEMGIFETQRGWAIVLKLKVVMGR